MERLQQILLFEELEFPLKEIKTIIDAPNFDRSNALEQQIELLTMKKEHLEILIDFARKIKTTGVNKMDFEVFDTTRIDEYARKAKEQWGQTSEYKEYEHLEVQVEVKKLQDYISEHFYKCSNEVLKGLGAMYSSGGEFTENIDKAAGSGTAVFVAKAIDIYCS